MPQKSSIKKLPADVLAQVNFYLTDSEMTLDDIIEQLEELGHRCSRSALGRYKQDVDKMSARLRASREMADIYGRELADEKNLGKTTRVLNDQVRMFALDFMTRVGASIDDEGNPGGLNPKDINELGRGLAALALADRRSQDFEAKLREQVQEEERNRAATIVEETGKKFDITPEALRHIREEIYSLKS